jgi:hypothetical protein
MLDNTAYEVEVLIFFVLDGGVETESLGGRGFHN